MITIFALALAQRYSAMRRMVSGYDPISGTAQTAVACSAAHENGTGALDE